MSRPKRSSLIDLTKPMSLTDSGIERLVCPPDKKQVFLRDIKVPGLKVRATAGGSKSFVFEGKLHRKNCRKTIGGVRSWTLSEARVEAKRLRVQLDRGDDPWELERLKELNHRSGVERRKLEVITVGEVWVQYLDERKPLWSDNHYRDHLAMARRAGQSRKRWGGAVTKGGPLLPLLPLKVVSIDRATLVKWAQREAQTRPSSARLALRHFKAFWNWCTEQKGLRDIVDQEAIKSKRLQEAVGRQMPRTDYLQRDQLTTWFENVQQIQNPIINAYLQCLLLTGARREELARLRWEDVNFQWKGITIRDKVDGSRSIPLTRYIEQVIQSLPRRNKWVFSSPSSESGRLINPAKAHTQVCRAAGLKVSLHGLRRSFKSLTEWLEVPVGVVAQIMGHKPNATAEKHYTIRPLDLLRVHHENIEKWILDQGGVKFNSRNELERLRIVGG